MIGIFNPKNYYILKQTILEEKELTKDEKIIKKLQIYINKLDNICVYCDIISLVAFQGILLGILLSGLIYINWLEILLVLIIPVSIYLFGFICNLINKFLWNKKLKLESKLGT